MQGKVGNPRQKQRTVRFLLDSGATYTVLPRKTWQALKLKAQRQMSFTLADGTTVRRDVSEAYIVLPQGRAHSPVIRNDKIPYVLVIRLVITIIVDFSVRLSIGLSIILLSCGFFID